MIEEEPVPEEDAKRKTFVTQKEEGGKEWAVAEYKTTYTLHDMIIPGGKAAKLVNITDPYSKELRMTEILNRLKFKDPLPVIILIGAATDRAAKALAGLVRAAHHTDAIILDSGLHSGIEKFCLRKGSYYDIYIYIYYIYRCQIDWDSPRIRGYLPKSKPNRKIRERAFEWTYTFHAHWRQEE